MNRNECIKILQNAGHNIAKSLGFSEVSINDGREKGIWGEDLTKYLEKYVECIEEIVWTSPDNPRNYVKFDFRFASPRLCLHTFDKGDRLENLASLEFSDTKAIWTDEGPRFIPCDDFRTSEKLIWGEKGDEYVKIISDVIAAEIEKNLDSLKIRESASEQEIEHDL